MCGRRTLWLRNSPRGAALSVVGGFSKAPVASSEGESVALTSLEAHPVSGELEPAIPGNCPRSSLLDPSAALV